MTKTLVTRTSNPTVIFNRRSPVSSQPMNINIKTMTFDFMDINSLLIILLKKIVYWLANYYNLFELLFFFTMQLTWGWVHIINHLFLRCNFF